MRRRISCLTFVNLQTLMLSAILYPAVTGSSYGAAAGGSAPSGSCGSGYASAKVSCFDLLQAGYGNRGTMSQQASPVGAFRPARIRVCEKLSALSALDHPCRLGTLLYLTRHSSPCKHTIIRLLSDSSQCIYADE